MNTVPYLPENAPFTAEQRAYLNGFFAGLFSAAPVAASPNAVKAPQPLTVLFGSQTGNSEALARRLAREAGQHGFAANLMDMAKYPAEKLATEKALAIITSTYGDGDPPDNARGFWSALSRSTAPTLSHLRYAVCALGDTNYAQFCAFGKALDEQLEKLGGCRVLGRVECDVDFEDSFKDWVGKLWPALAEQGSQPVQTAPVIQAPATVERAEALHNRNNPFPAPLIGNRKLNGEGSGKDTRHLAFSLARSSLAYEAGDALGVVPTNCPELVAEVLRILGAHGDETVPGPQGDTSLREALSAHCEITRISDLLLKAMAERTRDPGLVRLTAPGVNGELTQYLRGRDVIDLLAAFPSVKFEPAEFVKLLRKLQPRLYSISSSPKACASEVHLTVAVVRYTSFDRLRNGLCSAFLADRVPAGTPVPVFLHKNKHFRPPADPARPMIMVGPGTGIAPFRAFLQERRETAAPGRNWLFFGDQRQSCDFLYRDELEAMVRDSTLSRLDLAFSRDQSQKVYVQHRMLEHARELYSWLEEGAHFYVCGDAGRMAKDVDAALHKAIEIAGQKSPDQAQEYVRALAAAKRYQRDVY